jgi:hypothetical protein
LTGRNSIEELFACDTDFRLDVPNPYNRTTLQFRGSKANWD